MKIGDKVTFLSEKGGGRVAGFKGKNIVLVEDEDGFQIPMPINEVVVMGSGQEYETSRIVTAKSKAKPSNGAPLSSVKKQLNTFDEDNEAQMEPDLADLEVTFRKPVEERKGGNVLNCYLAFVPINVKDFSNTRFECYFVNDSNYHVHFTYLQADGVTWKLHYVAEVEPNTKEFIEEFGHADLNDLSRVALQLHAYKREKNFVLKPTVDVQFRLDPIKFYKLHAFSENDYFEQPALLYTIVENDQPARQLVVDAKKLKQELYHKEENSSSDQNTQDTYMRRYETGKKKGNPFVIKRKGDENVLVVDLHIDQLLDTTAGMSPTDMLNYQLGKFRQVLDEHKKEKGKRIIFIHGKGEGVLRHALLNDLRYRYKTYTYQDASFQEYGYGATQVTIK